MNNSHNQCYIPKSLISLILLLTFAQLAASHTHSCHHDKLNHTLEIADDNDTITSQSGRMLAQEQEFQNIRIYADFTHLQGLDPTLKSYIQNELLPAAINYYSQTLKIIRLEKNLNSKKAEICNLTTPEIFTGDGIVADLGLIVDASHEESEYIAYARACVLSRYDKRPVFGNVHFNLNYIQLGDENQHQLNLLITLHEMAHVLGISKGLFEFYYDREKDEVKTGHVKQREINGVNTFIVDVEPLTSKLQEFYGCSSIDGALLENEGPIESAKSHLERRIFFNEIMTASSIENPKISEFMLAFLEGTGWYKGNYAMSEPLYWGKGKGCSFYFGPCINKTSHTANFEEFCSGLSEIGCDASRRYGAACGGSTIKKKSISIDSPFDYWTDGSAVSDMFADNCPYFVASSSKDCQDPFQQNRAALKGEVYGAGSKCFTGNLFNEVQPTQEKTNYCLRASCKQQKDSSFTITVKLGAAKATCKAAGPITVPGYNGQLDCPDPNVYCSSYGQDSCTRGCMGRGQCVENKCQCEEGWGGPDCGTKIFKQNCTKCEDNPFMTTCYGDECGCMPNDQKCLCPDGSRDCVIELSFTQAERNELSIKNQELQALEEETEEEATGGLNDNQNQTENLADNGKANSDNIINKSGLLLGLTLLCILL